MILLVRALMAVIGMSLVAIGAPLLMFGFGIPIFIIGMGLLLVAADGDW